LHPNEGLTSELPRKRALVQDDLSKISSECDFSATAKDWNFLYASRTLMSLGRLVQQARRWN